jgi:DNA-binding CsgD family transcriptional regulator
VTIVKKNDSVGPALAMAEPMLRTDFLPKSDLAYPIIAEILRVVPAARWAFARVTACGELGSLLYSHGNSGDLSRLENEFERQRSKVKIGARIAATIGPLGDFESGITLLFADAHVDFGILTLLRTSKEGPFTSSEISALALSLDATSERLSALRNRPEKNVGAPSDTGSDRGDALHTAGTSESFYLLDGDLRIVLAWTSDEQPRIALTGLPTHLADRLPLVLEEAVRELTSGWQSDAATWQAGIAHPVPFLVVRTHPMSGPAGFFIGVRIDRFHPPKSLADPAAHFHISPRELQVLALLLDGAKLDEIGARLSITSSTIQNHIKSMVNKTGSRNRSELIARVLGWGEPPEGAAV